MLSMYVIRPESFLNFKLLAFCDDVFVFGVLYTETCIATSSTCFYSNIITVQTDRIAEKTRKRDVIDVRKSRRNFLQLQITAISWPRLQFSCALYMMFALLRATSFLKSTVHVITDRFAENVPTVMSFHLRKSRRNFLHLQIPAISHPLLRFSCA